MKLSNFCFVYARSDSTRLPGKAFFDISGKKLIDIVMEKAARVQLSESVLLTTDRCIDDKLADHVRNQGYRVVRGHATNLVERTLQALSENKASSFLRINGDSPFFLPEVVNKVLPYLDHYNLLTNLINRTFPYGVAVEWILADSYKELAVNAEDHEKEHVTQHLYRQLDKLKILSLEQSRNDSYLRLAVDTLDDYERLMKNIDGRDLSQLNYYETYDLSSPKLKVSEF